MASVKVEIRKPAGEEAQFVEAVKEAVRQYEAAGGMKWRGRPVAWQDILIQHRFGVDVPSLLTRFPTSTYAGYFLGLGEGFPVILDSKPEYVVQTLWRENYVAQHPVASLSREVTRDGKPCTVMAREPMGVYLQAQRARIERYLAVHPEHPRREVMELARAYQSLALGDKQTALRSLEWVATRAPSERWRKQAEAILALLKEEK